MKNLMDKYPRVLDLLPKAKKRLPHFASEYLFSGTGYDLAIKNNTEILKNIFLTPKYVQGVVEPNLKVPAAVSISIDTISPPRIGRLLTRLNSDRILIFIVITGLSKFSKYSVCTR